MNFLFVYYLLEIVLHLKKKSIKKISHQGGTIIKDCTCDITYIVIIYITTNISKLFSSLLMRRYYWHGDANYLVAERWVTISIWNATMLFGHVSFSQSSSLASRIYIRLDEKNIYTRIVPKVMFSILLFRPKGCERIAYDITMKIFALITYNFHLCCRYWRCVSRRKQPFMEMRYWIPSRRNWTNLHFPMLSAPPKGTALPSRVP